jgi:NitT/TauT family transport system ATP-binding protein
MVVTLDRVDLVLGGFPAIADLSFSVSRGQFVAIVGPTGCGKTSVLNLVAGLLKPSSGFVYSEDRLVSGINQNAAYVFQHDALLPWKSVLENVLLGPVLRGVPRRHAQKAAMDWIDRVGLRGLERRYPSQLSGGQRKRVAVAQALIGGLPLLLMDEPFSALDVQTRALMENELLMLWQDLRATVLFVTHDLEEAIALSDRVLILSSGPRSRLKGAYNIDLPRPRNVEEARFLPGFADIYQRVWSDLREEVRASYGRFRSTS